MKKKIIGILLAVTLTVSQAGIVVYAEDVTWEDEFTQMDEADDQKLLKRMWPGMENQKSQKPKMMKNRWK